MRELRVGRGPTGILIPVLLVVLFSGCTNWREYVANGFKVGPNYRKPAAAVADQWIDAADPNRALDTGPVDEGAWWRAFNDPVLDSLVDSAHRQNLSLRAAGMRVLEARAQRAIVAGSLFPQSQQLFGEYTRSQISQNRFFNFGVLNTNEWTLGANLAWELDFWGRFRRAIENADANLDASIEGYDDVLVVLLSEAAQRYVDLRTAEQRLEYALRNVESQRKSLKLATERFEGGATTRLDVTQGQSNLAQTEAAIAPLQTARRQAANQLCVLLGTTPGTLETVLSNRQAAPERIIPAAPPRVAVGIPAELLRRRPDIRRAEREVAAQSARIGMAVSELYPHFNINGTLFLDSQRFRDLFDSSSWAGSVGPSFRWDILNYGRLANNVALQDARFEELAYQYQNLVLQANAEAETALTSFLNAQQQVKMLQISVKASSESLELVRTQYKEGKEDFNRVLDIERLQTQQEDQLAVSQGNVAQSLILLYRALGGGWQIRLEDALPQPTPATVAAPDVLPRAVAPAPAVGPEAIPAPGQEKPVAPKPAVAPQMVPTPVLEKPVAPQLPLPQPVGKP